MASKKVAQVEPTDIGQRNRIRGIVGAVRARGFVQTDNRVQVFYGQLREALMAARVNVPPNLHEQYFEWHRQYLSTQLPKSFKRAPIGFFYLNGIVKGSIISFEQELLWVTCRLGSAANEINSFRRLADSLETSFWLNDKKRVKAIQLVMNRIFGQTLWQIESRIAILQFWGGLEAQKRYVDSVKGVFRRSILSYIAHYMSVRNEPNSTPVRFAADMANRIDRSRFAQATKVYLKRRLASQWPTTRAGLASMLRVEQGHGDIDLYESFVALLQYIVSESTDVSLRSAVQRVLPKLNRINDWRLDKLSLLLGQPRDVDRLPQRDHDAKAQFLSGDTIGACKSAYRSLRIHPCDLGQAIVAAQAIAVRGRRSPARTSTPWHFAIDRLSLLYSKTGDFDRAVIELLKFSRNFVCFPTAKAMLSLYWSEGIPRSFAPEEPARLKALNSRYLDADDMVVVPDVLLHTFDELLSVSPSLALDFARTIRTGSTPPNAIVPSLARYGIARHFERTRQYRQAYDALLPNLDGQPAALSIASARLAAECLIRTGDRSTAIDVIAELVTLNERVTSVLPIIDLLGDAKWADLEPFSDRLSLSVVVDLLWRQTSDDQIATLRRFAFDEFLTRNGMQRPTELANCVDQYPHAELVYYLRHLCVPPVMDMSMAFRSSRELEEERREVCGLLCQLDPANTEEYQHEIFEISNKLVIQDGLRLVDSSRLHVDVDAISRWASKELRESFSRYIDLVAAGIGVADDFEVVLRSLTKNDHSAKNFFAVPVNEADDLLVAMITALKEQFLFDTAHGLDSYLSKRVRHGSVPNHLRGPVEKAALITQRDATTQIYKRNEYWLNKFQMLGEEQAAAIEACFMRFAVEFDSIILTLKDKLLQIKSLEHPEGLFEIPLLASVFHIIRSGTQRDLTFDLFLRSCYSIFWGVLEGSLQSVRTHLRTNTKAEVAQAFEQLRAGLVSAADPLPELSMEIGGASADVQHRAEAIAEWFNRPEGLQGSRTYSLEQATEIAVASALNSMRAFKPKLEIAADSEYSLTANGLVTLTECVWVALENVRAHSGISPDPSITLRAEVRATEELVSITVESEVASSVRTAERDAQLQNIRNMIADGSFRDHVRREGNSGFLKVASVVAQSSRGRIEFGFRDSDRFFMRVDLASILLDSKEPTDRNASTADALASS